MTVPIFSGDVKYQHIWDVIPVDSNMFLFVMVGVNENIYFLEYDLAGQAREAGVFSKASSIMAFMSATGDYQMPFVWGSKKSYIDDPQVWAAKKKGGKFEKKLLLDKQKGVSFQKAWILTIGNQKNLFLQAAEYKSKIVKGKSKLKVVYWIYRYILEGNEVKLKTQTLVWEDESEPMLPGIECGIEDGEIYIWFCREGNYQFQSELRVSKLQENGKVKWVNCYKSRKNCRLRGPRIDRGCGSTALIFEDDASSKTTSAIICQLQDGDVKVNLGEGFLHTDQLIGANGGEVKWLLSGHKGWGLLGLDDEFKIVKEFRHYIKNLRSSRWVVGEDQGLYLALLTNDNRFKMEKIENVFDDVSTEP